MIQTVPFTKASGAGNDFVLVDNMKGAFAFDKARFAVAVCSRHFGVGADGLLVLEPSRTADFFMFYFNSDGSYGGMCGNGGRCAARYAFLNGLAGPHMRFEALSYTYEAEMTGSRVRLRMKDPGNIRFDLSVTAGSDVFECHFVDTGSPHVVVFDPDLDTREVMKVGRRIRDHVAFAPKGANVNFVRITHHDALDVRTYERGVEAETLACGTGAVASAVIARLKHAIEQPVRVTTRSGEELVVHFQEKAGDVTGVYLEGSAYMLFAGTVTYDPSEGRILSSHEELVPTSSGTTP